MESLPIYRLKKSKISKWLILTPKGKSLNFGAKGYQDFTMHKDEDRKKNYIIRHKTNENWNNPETRGFWARWLLWNKENLDDSIKDIEERFKIKIIKEY